MTNRSSGRLILRLGQKLASTLPTRQRVGNLERYTEQALQDIRDELVRIRQKVEDLSRDVAVTQVETVGVRAENAAISARHKSVQADLRLERARLAALLARAAPSSAGTAEIEVNPDVRLASDEFLYYELEERFRGSRHHVRDLMGTYLEDVRHLTGGTAPVLDLGIGRGEWLEVLRDNRIPAWGVDASDLAVQQGKELGLDVRHADALDCLRSIEDFSLGAVTAIHLVEHLPPDQVLAILEESLRTLRSGGVMIIETPNPRNITVGASDFYLDPTHRRPVHPFYLQTVVEHLGFENEVRYLHAPGDSIRPTEFPGPCALAVNDLIGRLNELLYGCRDYAIVARKLENVA